LFDQGKRHARLAGITWQKNGVIAASCKDKAHRPTIGSAIHQNSIGGRTYTACSSRAAFGPDTVDLINLGVATGAQWFDGSRREL
jgi:hypothetical protein